MTVRELIEKLKEMPQDALVLDEDDYKICKVETEEYFGEEIVRLEHRL